MVGYASRFDCPIPIIDGLLTGNRIITGATLSGHNEKRRQIAYHEAGHAVQAHFNGLGVLRLGLGRGEMMTVRQHELENAGLRLADPISLDDRLPDFYRLDIEVRMAGPLATCRQTTEDSGGAALLPQVKPRKMRLTLHGGAADEEVALCEAQILARWDPMDPAAYVGTVKERVWRETVLDPHRWSMIQHVATALEENGELGELEFRLVIGSVVLDTC